MIGVLERFLDGFDEPVEKRSVFSMEILRQPARCEEELGFDFVIRLRNQMLLQSLDERLRLGELRTQT